MLIVEGLMVCSNIPVFAILLDHGKGKKLHTGAIFILCLYGVIWLLAGLPWFVTLHLALASPLLILGYIGLLSALRKVRPTK